MNVPELAGTYIPGIFSDLMGSSEPSIWLCATRLQAFHPSSQMGEIDAATSVHCALYIASSILRFANGASPPRIRFSRTSLHTCCLHTVYRRSDGLSSSSGTSHGDAIEGEPHRRRSRLSEASGSSVPPMRLSIKSLHAMAVPLRFSRAGALTTDDGGRVHALQLREHRKHLQAAVDSVVRHASAHQSLRLLFANACQGAAATGLPMPRMCDTLR